MSRRVTGSKSVQSITAVYHAAGTTPAGGREHPLRVVYDVIVRLHVDRMVSTHWIYSCVWYPAAETMEVIGKRLLTCCNVRQCGDVLTSRRC